jgi:hypothetical protein
MILALTLLVVLLFVLCTVLATKIGYLRSENEELRWAMKRIRSFRRRG